MWRVPFMLRPLSKSLLSFKWNSSLLHTFVSQKVHLTFLFLPPSKRESISNAEAPDRRKYFSGWNFWRTSRRTRSLITGIEKYIIIKQSVCANKYAALEITCDELTMSCWRRGGKSPETGHLNNGDGDGDGDDPNSIFSSPQLNCQWINFFFAKPTQRSVRSGFGSGFVSVLVGVVGSRQPVDGIRYSVFGSWVVQIHYPYRSTAIGVRSRNFCCPIISTCVPFRFHSPLHAVFPLHLAACIRLGFFLFGISTLVFGFHSPQLSFFLEINDANGRKI